ANRALGRPLESSHESMTQLELANHARIVCLPGQEETIRGLSAPRLLILDEAARVPDDLYRSVRPMLAVSRGRLVCLSTPFGQRGWFHDEWTGSGPWKRVHISWHQCPRISADFIAEETRALGQQWVDQEYGALFTALEGLVFPDFARAVADPPGTGEADQPTIPESWEKVGGIDFGWRNPFAAVWGHVDDQGVLWITGERYRRETPLAVHAAALPQDVIWYA